MEKRSIIIKWCNWMICLSFIIYHLSFSMACSHAPKDVVELDTLPPIYPDYCNVTIPENIAPLNFLLRADCEAIEVKAGELVLNASGNEAVFNMDDWKTLMQQSSGKDIEVTITALVNGTWKQYKSFRWQVVGDRVDPYLT